MSSKSLKILGVIFGVILLMVFSAGCSSKSKPKQAENGPQYGGTINVAMKTAPPHLDSDKSTDWTISGIMNHAYEGLFEMNDKYEAIPQLVESSKLLDGDKTYDFILRKGVKFHNRKEMTAEDVKASFDRWFRLNEAGQMVKPYLNSVDVVGPYEITVNFKQKYAPFLNILASPVANQKMVVRPKEIIDKFGDQTITEHIGTGPYVFDSWVPDQSVTLKKFNGYVPNPAPAAGFAGRRVAYADEIVSKFVSEDSVRVAGVKTGEFQFALEVPQDQYDELSSNPDVNPVIVTPGMQGMLTINCGKAPFNNIYARRALAAGIDMDELGTAQIGNKKFWNLDGCLFPKGSIWYDQNAGKGIYATRDIELAKKYLKESGYNGEPIVILNGKDDNVESQGALDLKSQLEKIGFKVDVQLYDRPTVVEKRSKVEGWDLHLTYFDELNPDPQVFGAWVGTNGWITNWNDSDSKRMDDIFERMMGETDSQKRYQIVQEWYQEFWKDMPYVKTINYSGIHLLNKSLKGYVNFCQPFFWNCWVEK